MSPRAAGRTAFTLIAALALGACAGEPAPEREWTPEDHGHPRMADPARMPGGEQGAAEPSDTGEAPELRAARALFNVSCAGCHGRDGRGEGPKRPPGAQVPDMTVASFQSARTDAQLAQVIAKGRDLMPAFEEKINADGIRALVAYLRTLGQGVTAAQAAPEPDPGAEPEPEVDAKAP
ncbi:MAG: cytochrome c [Myxococcales bacterium]